MKRQINVGLDVFAAIWAARLPNELDEDQILARLLKLNRAESGDRRSAAKLSNPTEPCGRTGSDGNKPKSKKWTDVLIWSLQQLGGKATLAEIYEKSREGRKALGHHVTNNHDASARECLESHCSESKKYRLRADLFYMPEGKGAGVWALR